ncbi:IS110 family transposase [Pseudovibrio ascidiaceicola]|uniref:IS110 family transposase n=1 Tax=Pseudovibrio ascidiaceicola TaxID=285279 RepID=UPI003D366515
MTGHTIGIDISKSHLDVFRLEDESAKRFDNSPRGHDALIKWLGALPVARIVFEPTGPYHRAVEVALSGKFPLVKVNPLQARRFAQACGTYAKTDAVDARILARMGASLALEADEPVNEKLHNLRDLQVARTALVKERIRLRNSGHGQTNSLLKRHTKARLTLVERQIGELNEEIAKRLAEDEQAARKNEILCSIPGLGQISAAVILTFLPEIGMLDRKQAGSLAGLVPYNRESGTRKGKSFISGGRKPLRDALYMPALVAMRFNPDLKAKYTQLRDAGKPAKVAIVAIMRKLLETANALVKADRIWTKKRPCT